MHLIWTEAYFFLARESYCHTSRPTDRACRVSYGSIREKIDALQKRAQKRGIKYKIFINISKI